MLSSSGALKFVSSGSLACDSFAAGLYCLRGPGNWAPISCGGTGNAARRRSVKGLGGGNGLLAAAGSQDTLSGWGPSNKFATRRGNP